MREPFSGPYIHSHRRKKRRDKEARPLYRAISPVRMTQTIQTTVYVVSQLSILLRKWNNPQVEAVLREALNRPFYGCNAETLQGDG